MKKLGCTFKKISVFFFFFGRGNIVGSGMSRSYSHLIFIEIYFSLFFFQPLLEHCTLLLYWDLMPACLFRRGIRRKGMILKEEVGHQELSHTQQQALDFPALDFCPGSRLLQKTFFLREVSRVFLYNILSRSSHFWALWGNTHSTGFLCSSCPHRGREGSLGIHAGNGSGIRPWGWGVKHGAGLEASTLT